VFDLRHGTATRKNAFRLWRNAVHGLPEGDQARVELELGQVNEVAHTHAIELLTAAARSRRLPTDSIPGNAARALWFFLHYPDLFHDTLLGQELADGESWRAVAAPRSIAIGRLPMRKAALAASLKELFQSHEGTGRFCTVDAYRLDYGTHFVAHVSHRVQVFDTFTDAGRHKTRAARRAFRLVFVYDPRDGRVFLRARQRSGPGIQELLRRFGRTVLGVELGSDCLAPAFRLDRLKEPFRPTPDAEDMESVRVKALHLTYPERTGRRRVRLETVPGDAAHAIPDLLRDHGGGVLDQLDVLYAELEVRLRLAGRSKPVTIRLWPDRANLNGSPLGRRLRACLERWGLTHAA
jgi:hypothetical protein